MIDNIESIARKRVLQDGETWNLMAERVGHTIAANEDDPHKWTMIFSEMIKKRTFLPNSPTLRNAGTMAGTLSACFVLPIGDSRRSIFNCLADAVEIQSKGGGMGMNLSYIRPRGSRISWNGGIASGPISFAEVFDFTIGNVITQGAGIRQGAMMAVLDINHPDIYEFITTKSTEGRLSNFNMSVAITDSFMNRIEADQHITLSHPKSVVKIPIPARGLWGLIAKMAWTNGEPGVIFIDTVNRTSPYDRPIRAVNPCLPDHAKLRHPSGWKALRGTRVGDLIWSRDGWTEILVKVSKGVKPVYRYSTLAGSIDATKDHKVIYGCGKKVEISEANRIATLSGSDAEIYGHEFVGDMEVWDITVDNDSHTFFANGFNVCNCGEQPLPDNYGSCNLGSIDISKFINKNKQTILWEDLDREIINAVRFLDNIIDVNNYPIDAIKKTAKQYRPIGLGIMGLADAMIMCDIVYGSTASINFTETIMSFFQVVSRNASIALGNEKGGTCFNSRRNVTTLSIAPTGTLSLLANCSSGIEPIFSGSYTKACIGKTIEVKHNMINMPAFITAQDVAWREQIDVVAAAQKYVDSGISKTVNMPNSATVEDVQKAFTYAYVSGCKSITVYRNGSRDVEALQDNSCNDGGCMLCD